MKNLQLFLFLSGLLLSCSAIRISGVETADNINLHGYKTYDFYEVTAKGDTIPAIFNERLALIRIAIATEMNSKGFTRSTSGPDLLINIGVQVKKETATRETNFGQDGPFYIGQRNYAWKSKSVETGTYRNGYVTVHLVDARQVKLVWQGTVEAMIPGNDKQLENDIRKGMAKLFADLPLRPQ
ncbi:MAG: DUF4136 domain-containing protein [Chitinophagaceae bacterium]